MAVEIYTAWLTLMEHTYFASREVGIFYESEPLIGNYALAYALGLCAAPYSWGGPPRYKQDLGPLNDMGLYVTPATFAPDTLRYAISQFNAQTDSYYFRFDQNAIGTEPGKKVRAMNFPQSGKIRMLGLGSKASFFLFNQQGRELRLPPYIRLGKFNSKARLEWEKLTLKSTQPVERDEEALDFLLNAADLPPAMVSRLRAFSVYNVYPAPLLSRSHLGGDFWQCTSRAGKDVYLPAGMRFGVDAIA
jgi:CRISPR-associated protein Csc1